jgi:hypothetical protein
MFEMKEDSNTNSDQESDNEDGPKLTAIEQEIIHM